MLELGFRKPAKQLAAKVGRWACNIMITEAFFLVARFELEGYDEFIGSRCVVRVAEQTTEANSLSRCGIKKTSIDPTTRSHFLMETVTHRFNSEISVSCGNFDIQRTHKASNNILMARTAYSQAACSKSPV